MTTNKPEVVAEVYQHLNNLIVDWKSPASESVCVAGDQLIRLSDYEARMAVLFDGHAVYSAMTDKAKQHTSYESVAAVLDAVVKLMREVSNDSQ